MKTKPINSRTGLALFAAIATALIGNTARAQHYEHKEHHLGPTGLFGVTSPTNIKITQVQALSPADGKIQVGDVIVGAGGALFKENTRRQLSWLRCSQPVVALFVAARSKMASPQCGCECSMIRVTNPFGKVFS